MALRKDEIQLEVEINGQKAGKSLRDLQRDARNLKRELNQLAPGTDAFNKKAAELKRVNTVLADARKQTRGVAGGLDNMRKSASTLPGTFRGIGAALNSIPFLAILGGVIGLFQKVKQIGQESLELFDLQAKADAQLRSSLESTEGVAGRTFEQLKKQASELQKLTNIGDEVTNQTQSILLTFTNVREQVFDRTIPVIQDVAVKLAEGDAEAANFQGTAIQLGKALNDPVSGLSSLAEAGIQFTASQKEVIKNLVETGRQAEAQNLILDELERQFKGSAQAAAEAGTGGFQALSGRIADVKEQIGFLINQGLQRLRPVLEGVVTFLEGFISAVISGEKATGRFSGAINFIIGRAKAWINIFKTTRAVIAGLISVNQVAAKEIQDFFTRTLSSAQIFQKQLELALTIREGKKNELRNEIRDLQELRADAQGAGKSIGEAFREGYQESLNAAIFQEDARTPVTPVAANSLSGSNDNEGGESANKKVQNQLKQRIRQIKESFEIENLLIQQALLNNEINESESQKRRADAYRAFLESQVETYRMFNQTQTAEAIRVQNELIVLNQAGDTMSLEALDQLNFQQIERTKIANDAILKIVKDRQQQELESFKQTQQQKDNIIAAGVDSFAQSTGAIIDLIGEEIKARDKNASILKGLEIAKIRLDTVGEISAIWRNAQSTPAAKLLGPGAGVAFAVIQSALALGRSRSRIQQIRAQNFADGGFVKRLPYYSGQRINDSANMPSMTNGDNILATVRTGEVVLNKKQQAQLGGPGVFRSIGVPGFQSGGLVTVDTNPVVQNIDLGSSATRGTQTESIVLELRALRMEFERFKSIKAVISYTEFENTQEEITSVRNEANL